MERFHQFFFAVIICFRRLPLEKQDEAFSQLKEAYHNADGAYSSIYRDGPVRGFLGSLIFSIAVQRKKPEMEFVRIGPDGDRFAGFGLLVVPQILKSIREAGGDERFLNREISHSQLWFSHIEGDLGFSNVRFSRKAGRFMHLKNTLNADESENWYSGNLEKSSVTFCDNAGAYSWIENSCAFGRVAKCPSLQDYALPDDLDKFALSAIANSTP
jgi:hypothetical protein